MRIALLTTTVFATPILLAGYAHQIAADRNAISRTGNAFVAPTSASVPKPQFGTYGFDTAGMDSSVSPGDDFYVYANGIWAKNTPIPSDKSNVAMADRLDDLSSERTRAILEEAKGDAHSKSGIAYATYLDTAAIDAKGRHFVNAAY